MAFTKRFRDQHNDLLDIAAKMSNYLNSDDEVTKNADNIRNLLSKLRAKLIAHLGGEDQFLYPKLLNNSDKKIQDMAKAYMEEMGGIKNVFEDYKNKWSSGEAIKGDPASFITETKGLFDALGKRIDRENNELYPMVDKVM